MRTRLGVGRWDGGIDGEVERGRLVPKLAEMFPLKAAPSAILRVGRMGQAPTRRRAVRGRFPLLIARVLARRFSRASLGVRVLLLWALVGAAPAAANTISVNGTGDVVANDGQCTLREAITAANTDTASGNASGECAVSGADTIVVPAGTHEETLTGFEDSNAGGDFDLYSDLTIQGAGWGTLSSTVTRSTGCSTCSSSHLARPRL